MYKKDVIIRNQHGLHARPVSLFIQKACKFQSDIKLKTDGKEVDGKSILGVISAGIRCNDKITISAVGGDEEEAVEELVKFVETYKE